MDPKNTEKAQLKEFGFIIEDADQELKNDDALIEIPSDLSEAEDKEQDNKQEDDNTPDDQEDNQEEEQEDNVSEGEDSKQGDRPRKNYRHTERQRIHTLTKQLREAQSAAYVAAKSKEDTEKALWLAQKEKIEHYEHRIQAEKKNVIAALQNAEDEGDSETKAKALDLLSQYNARLEEVSKDKRDVQSRMAEQYVEDKQQRQYEQPTQQQYNDPKITKIAQGWLKNNRWADPNDPNFDEEMYTDADRYSIELARTYKLDGRAEHINTSEFFNDISAYINESYRIDAPSSRGTQTLQMKKPSALTSAPVNRTSSMSTKTPTRLKTYEDIKLTDAEVRTAYGLVNAQAAKNRDEAIKLYKQQKYKIMSMEGKI